VESKWRMNVVRFGLNPALVRLCSPLLGNDFWKLSDYVGTPGYHVAWFNHPSDPNNYNFGSLLPDRIPGSNFPYGWNVEPD